MCVGGGVGSISQGYSHTRAHHLDTNPLVQSLLRQEFLRAWLLLVDPANALDAIGSWNDPEHLIGPNCGYDWGSGGFVVWVLGLS